MTKTETVLQAARPTGARQGDGGAPAAAGVGLVGDIGGTNARFALAETGPGGVKMSAFKALKCRNFPGGVVDALRAYLAEVGLATPPAGCVIAVAGPVTHGRISLTNLGWSFSEADLEAMGFGRARLINDYEALALGAAHYCSADLRHVGGPAAGEPGATLAVLGAGTGFGVSALGRDGRCEVALATEGGHMAFAPHDELEFEILRRLMQRFGRVSVERILSGPGIALLHAVLAEIHGEPPQELAPADIAAAAAGGDKRCARTIEQFCAVYGAVAGDLALALGARGGVFLGGGIAPAIADLLAASRFRERFDAKGRFAGYMQAIPTWIITHPQAALIGAASRL